MSIFGLRSKPQRTTREMLQARYAELCAKRDEVNGRVAPLQKDLDAANMEAQVANAKARKIADAIQALRGGQEWLDIKREIGLIAKALSGK